MTPSKACISIVQEFEGCAKLRSDGRFDAYPDPASGADPWTVGWGSTGPDVKPGVIWTQDECDQRLENDLTAFSAKVTNALGGAATNQNQFDALISFAYNLGVGNLESSTLLKMHKAGDYAGAAGQFGRWNKAGGKVMSGLTRRRAAEAALYSS